MQKGSSVAGIFARFCLLHEERVAFIPLSFAGAVLICETVVVEPVDDTLKHWGITRIITVFQLIVGVQTIRLPHVNIIVVPGPLSRFHPRPHR